MGVFRIISNGSPRLTFGIISLVQMHGGGHPGHIANHPGGVPMAGQVFSQVDVSRPQMVNRSIGQSDLRLAG